MVNYTSGAFPERLRSGRVSADFFKLFGAPILKGRTFSAEEDRPDGDPPVFVSVPFVPTGVAFVAVWLRARRASRIDPIIALRAE